jgi:hypothetical protein
LGNVTAEMRENFIVLTDEFELGYMFSDSNKIKTQNAQPEIIFTLWVMQCNVKLYCGTCKVQMQVITRAAMKGR